MKVCGDGLSLNRQCLTIATVFSNNFMVTTAIVMTLTVLKDHLLRMPPLGSQSDCFMQLIHKIAVPFRATSAGIGT